MAALAPETLSTSSSTFLISGAITTYTTIASVHIPAIDSIQRIETLLFNHLAKMLTFAQNSEADIKRAADAVNNIAASVVRSEAQIKLAAAEATSSADAIVETAALAARSAGADERAADGEVETVASVAHSAKADEPAADGGACTRRCRSAPPALPGLRA